MIYKRILSTKELPSDKVVYQWDSGFWYDWDLSNKSDEELGILFQSNIIYVKESDV